MLIRLRGQQNTAELLQPRGFGCVALRWLRVVSVPVVQCN